MPLLVRGHKSSEYQCRCTRICALFRTRSLEYQVSCSTAAADIAAMYAETECFVTSHDTYSGNTFGVELPQDICLRLLVCVVFFSVGTPFGPNGTRPCNNKLCRSALLCVCAFHSCSDPDEVQAALEGLSTVGGVSVTKEYLGLSQAADDVNFPVWTVTFDGECSYEGDVWASCPANIGDLEVRDYVTPYAKTITAGVSVPLAVNIPRARDYGQS